MYKVNSFFTFSISFFILLFSLFIYSKENPLAKKSIDKGTERIYPSTLSEGYIGVFDDYPIDSPTDNVFTVRIDELPSADETVYLSYELYGISNHTGISRSINDQLSVGGYFVAQNSTWQAQTEQLKDEWLKQGDNQIRFTLPYGVSYNYRIRNLQIQIKKTGVKGRAIVLNQTPNAEYAGDLGYIKGFLIGNGSDKAKVTIVQADGELTLSNKGEFESLVPKNGNGTEWQTTIKATFPDGQTIEQTVYFKQPVTINHKNSIPYSSGVYSSGKYSAENGLKLSVASASINAGAQSLAEGTNISITALRSVDIPALDGAMVNVTKDHQGFRFLPHGTQFAKDAQVTLAYDVEKLPKGYTADDVKTFYFDEISKHWIPLERDSIQNVENAIVSRTSHFTDMINGVIKVPESPETAGFIPTSITDIKAANPSLAINTIEPPSANNTGSASLSYPIEIPAGRHGMQPQLAIQYNSGGGGNWLGVGWNLSTPSVSIDTRWGVPRYSGSKETETYTLSGEELTPVAHRGEPVNRVSDRQYYPRVEGSFNKIIRKGSTPKNYYWEVTDKSGTKNFYGATSSGSLVQDALLKDDAGNIAQWSLVETIDLNGNNVKYYYTKVEDAGVAGSTYMGYNTYLKSVKYTGSNSTEGNYEVVFIRDRELKEGLRKDISINARFGFKQVKADLLRKIHVKYSGTLIRAYDLVYREGAFYKTLLTQIRHLNEKEEEFNKHEFEYYDDVKAAEGYQPYTDVSSSAIDDGVNGGFLVKLGDKYNDNSSAISGSKSSGRSVGMAVTAGVNDFMLTTKSMTAGANFNYSTSDSEGMLSLIDINGDNLPDKVFVEGGTMKFRPNITKHGGEIAFGDVITVRGGRNFSISKTESYTVGIEANFVAHVSGQRTSSETETSTYFSDVNSDGLIDIVSYGVVYFNRLVDGVPTFTKTSAGTPRPIAPSEAGVVSQSPISNEELNERIDKYPLHDVVRVWEAPYAGTVSIDAPVSLDPAEKSTDGVRAVIQHKDRELWNTTIIAKDFGVKSASLRNIRVTKGERIYFRLQSVFEGEADVVLWNPVITYSEHSSDKVDANNLPIYQFKASDGFIISAEQNVGAPIDGTVAIKGTFEKPETSDDVTISIFRKDDKNNDILPAVWEKKYKASEKVTEPFDMPLAVKKAESYTFRVSADSNINWQAVKWNPEFTYTSSADPKVTTVTKPDGSPMLQSFPVVDYKMFNEIINQSATWKATADTIKLKVTPRIIINDTVSITLGMVERDTTITGKLAFTIKTKNKLVSKKIINIKRSLITSVSLDTTIVALKDEVYYFDLQPVGDIITKLSLAKVDLVAIDVATNNTVNTTKNPGISLANTDFTFGPMYRNWGQFGYNGNKDRATQAINEVDLKTSSYSEDEAKGMEGLKDAKDINDMESSFAGKGGENVNETKFIPMLADKALNAWKGFDDKHWLSQEKQSSSRLGKDILNDRQAITSDGTTVAGIVKHSKSVSYGFSAGGYGLGANYSTATSTTKDEFMDLNGDSYPDIVYENRIIYTKPDGTHEAGETPNDTGFFSVSSNDAIGLSVAPVQAASLFKKGQKDDIFNQKAGSSVGVTGAMSDSTDETSFSFMDVNGDGLADKVEKNGNVRLNLGYRFAPAEPWGFSGIRSGSGTDKSAGLGYSSSDGSNSISVGIGLSSSDVQTDISLQDINGDGLPDFFDKKSAIIKLNTGNGFVPINWSGLTDVQKSENIGQSVNASFTIGIPLVLPIPVVKLCINPSGSVSTSVSRETVSISDIDGDGNPDILTSGKESQLSVKKSTIARTNMLKGVKRPLGSSFELDYAKVGNTYNQPSSQWVLSSVTIQDGLAGDGADFMQNKFEYENGYYDRNSRDFYGFGTVKTHQIDTQQESKVYRTQIQKFLNDNYYEKGKVKEEILVNNEEAIFTKTINSYELKDVKTGAALQESFKTSTTEPAFVALKQTLKEFYEGSGSAQKSNQMQYEYDVWGNVVTYTDLGDGDEIKSEILYDLKPTKYIMASPKSAIVKGGGKIMRKTEATINQDGNIIEIRKYLESGNPATYNMTYDNYGNLTKLTFPKNEANQSMFYSYKYDTEVNSFVTEISDAFGYKSTAQYNYTFGQILETTDLNGNKMEYAYDNLGRLTKVKGPLEVAAGKEYTIAFAYFPNADVPYATTKHFDPAFPDNPIETVTFIDGLKRAVQVKKDISVFAGIGMPDVEKMVVSGRVTFDAFGRSVESYYPVEEDKGKETVFNDTKDAISPTITAYDVQDRPTTVTLPDKKTSTTEYGFGADRENKMMFSTKSTDPNNIWKQSFTDIRGKTTATKEQYSQEKDVWTSFTYNALGELLGSKDNLDNQTLSEYDMLGRRTKVTHPDAGETTLKYDLNGNVTEKLTANLKQAGTPIKYKYDFGRLIEINYPQNTQNDVKYHYGDNTTGANSKGRLILQEDGSGAQEFSYNALGAIIKNTRTLLVPDAPSVTYETQWTYDTWNRVTEMIYPDKETLTYTYNKGGLLREMSSPQTKHVSQLGYDKFEQRVFLSHGNGTQTEYSYEPERKRLHTVQTKTKAGRLIMDNIYTYDNADNIIQLENKATPPPSNLMGGQTSYTYKYDDLYQLVQADGNHKTSTHEDKYTMKMSYNSVRGITRKEQIHQFKTDEGWAVRKASTDTLDYAYNKDLLPHAPMKIGDKTYTYDANGNQTGWKDTKNHQERAIIWDEENRIKAISNNGSAFYYLYDASGERTVKLHGGQLSVAVNGSTKQSSGSIGNASIYVNPYLVVSNGKATKHYYIGTQRISSQLNESNEGLLQKKAGGDKVPYSSKQADLEKAFGKTSNGLGVPPIKVIGYAGGSGKIPPGQSGIHPDHGNGNGNNDGETTPPPTDGSGGAVGTGGKLIFFYHPDHLGSSSYISDSNGEVSQHLEYYAFGETFIEEHSNTHYIAYKFNGKELDEETGLYYYSARYYDPATAVFLSVDPLAEKTGTPYAYCSNNPIMRIDPSGMIDGDFVTENGNKIGNDGKNDDNIYIVPNKDDVKKIRETDKNGGTTQPGQVSSAVTTTKTEMKEALNVLNRTEQNGGFMEESSVVTPEGGVTRGERGSATTKILDNGTEVATTALPSVSGNNNTSIHSHPTGVKVVDNIIKSSTATEPGPSDPATFSGFKRNIIVGNLGYTTGQKQLDGSIQTFKPSTGAVIYNRNSSTQATITKRAMIKMTR